MSPFDWRAAILGLGDDHLPVNPDFHKWHDAGDAR